MGWKIWWVLDPKSQSVHEPSTNLSATDGRRIAGAAVFEQKAEKSGPPVVETDSDGIETWSPDGLQAHDYDNLESESIGHALDEDDDQKGRAPSKESVPENGP